MLRSSPAHVRSLPSLKGKKPSYTIKQKLKVLNFADQLARSGGFCEKAVMARFQGEIKLSQGMLGRWRAKAQEQQWHRLPQDVLDMKEIPNHVRIAFRTVQVGELPGVADVGLPILPMKGVDPEKSLPTAVADHLDKVLSSRVSGVSEVTKLAEPMGDKDMLHALKGVVKAYNNKVRESNEAGQKRNKQLLVLLEEGVIDPVSAMTMARKMVPPAQQRTTRTWTTRFRDRYDWSKNTTGMTGIFLPYNHPEMERVRQKVTTLRTVSGVHPRLILNYDQLWKLAHRGRKRKFYKEFYLAGQAKPRPRGKGSRRTKSIAPIVKQRRVMAKTKTHADIPTKKKQGTKSEQAPVRNPVGNERLPHTICTSTWSDGTRGPLLLVYKACHNVYT